MKSDYKYVSRNGIEYCNSRICEVQNLARRIQIHSTYIHIPALCIKPICTKGGKGRVCLTYDYHYTQLNSVIYELIIMQHEIKTFCKKSNKCAMVVLTTF